MRVAPLSYGVIDPTAETPQEAAGGLSGADPSGARSSDETPVSPASTTPKSTAQRSFARARAGEHPGMQLLERKMQASLPIPERRTPPNFGPTTSEAPPIGPAIIMKAPSVGGLPTFGTTPAIDDPTEHPLGMIAHGSALNAVGLEPDPDPKHPYVAAQAETRAALDKLGISRAGDARIHIDDLDPQHGAAVTRAAAGRTSLATGPDVTFNYDGVKGVPNDRPPLPKNPSSRQVVNSAADVLETSLLGKTNRLARIRAELPPGDNRKTLVNMSWGASPNELANEAAVQILAAPAGSKLHREATAALGRPPSVVRHPDGRVEMTRDEVRALRKKLVDPELSRALADPARQERIKAARTGLERELSEGRKQGMLVFVSAGNASDPKGPRERADWSAVSSSGVPRLVSVGAIDSGGPGFADDRVAPFSSGGSVQVSAPGVRIPVGDPERPGGPATDEDGTSFSSPIALQTAYLMNAANPHLSADQLAGLLQDPRAVHDIKATTRDGAGEIDTFAAVLLAKNPTLTSAQIESARQALGRNDADVAQIKRSLGL
jgi:hypothetical protein